MKYRILGSTSLQVSVVGVGTWQLGGEWGKTFTQDEVNTMFDTARQTGINLIDTAECYGDHTAETFVGNAVRSDRAKWIIATKFGHKFHSHLNRTDECSPVQVAVQLEDSLKALRTDYVDLLQYHSVRDEDYDNDQLTALLENLVKIGKVRHLGVSIGSNDNIHQTDNAGKHHVQVVQVVYNRLDRTPEKRVFASCLRHNLGVLARVPLASGYLSGKHKPGETFAANDWRSVDKTVDQKLVEAQRIQREEVPAGTDMATWALAWCLQHPAVTAVIPGCKSVEQVHANAAAADLDMVRSDHPQARA